MIGSTDIPLMEQLLILVVQGYRISRIPGQVTSSAMVLLGIVEGVDLSSLELLRS